MTQPLSPNLLPIVPPPGLASGESSTGDPMAFTRELHRELQRDALSATKRTSPAESSRQPLSDRRSTSPSDSPRRSERQGGASSSASSQRSSKPQDRAASASESSQHREDEADTTSTSETGASNQQGDLPLGSVPVTEENPQLSPTLTEGEGAVGQDGEEQLESIEVANALQNSVAAVVNESAGDATEVNVATTDQKAATERSTSAPDATVDPALEAAANSSAAEEQSDNPHQQPTDQSPAPTEKASGRGTAKTTDSATPGEAKADHRAATADSQAVSTENSLSTPSGTPAGESAGLDLPPDTGNLAERADSLQSHDAPKEARPAAAPLAHRLHSTLLSGQSSPATETEPRGQVDPARFVSRVTRAFQAAEQRGGVVQLRLSPPELGAMRIELSVQQGVMSARLETETQAAKSVLLDNLPALRERLAAMDIRVDKFDVDVRQDGSSKQDQWQSEQQGGDRRQSRSPETVTPTSRGASGTRGTDDTPRPPVPSDGRLNVIA